MKRKIVLITGATSGIGKATAKIFAKKGHDLILTGRRQQKLKEVARKISQKYVVKTLPLCFDVRDYKSVKKNLEKLKSPWSKVDILINNAGLAKGLSTIDKGDISHWNTMIDTNIKGLLYVTRIISPRMIEQGGGHIINVASIAGKEVYPNGNVYCGTKHAVDALTKGMRIDLHKFGIRVGQIAPGHVEETEFAEVRFDGDKEKARIYSDFKPTNSKDIAKIIYFMCTQPKHVNIQDVLVMGSQQASATIIDRSGRD